MLELVNRRRGLFVKLPSIDVIDMIAGCGFDFAVIDLEHSQLSESDASVLVRHAQAIGIPALVRLAEVDRGLVNRLLEAGAAGIQLSTVRRVSEVHQLRDATRYAPDGSRSISLSHPQAQFGALPLAEYLQSDRSKPPLLVGQIETAKTEDPLDEILSSGIDVAFLGMTDLSVDFGLDPARTHARVEQVAAAAQRAGVALGAFGLHDERVRYDVVSSDLALLRGAMANAA
jgi:4-hydroxy-2-oxoheptanedioate aldolase